jgi:carboxyl-terminal processing protease
MKSSPRILPILFAAIAAAGCAGETTTPALPGAQLSAGARAYLDSALNIMEARSLHRDAIQWSTFRQQMVALAAGAQEPRHTYSTIAHALEQLGDNHSRFLTPVEYAAEGIPTVPQGQLLEGRVGYLKVPGFSGSNPAAHAQQYHDLLGLLDRPATCGWVVDLRNNTGGNMWPMLAGVGPLLGTDQPGSFVDAGGARMVWTYRNGAAGSEPGAAHVTVQRPHALSRPGAPVAILANSTTASAGEAVWVAFRGRANTRSFGALTYGVPTANQGFVMPDGALLLLTVARFADRAGTAYDAPLPPDEEHAGYFFPLPDDALANRALQWVTRQPGCAEAE